MARILILLLLALLYGSTASSQPTIIFDNGGPNLTRPPTLSDGTISDVNSAGSPQSADDFSLATGLNVVQGVRWYGQYRVAFSSPDDFTIFVFTDTGGIPSTMPLYAFSIGDIGRTTIGTNAAGRTVYQFTAAIPATTLTAGTTYWLSVMNNSPSFSGDDDFVWQYSILLNSAAQRFSNFLSPNAPDPWRNAGAFGRAFNLLGPTIVAIDIKPGSDENPLNLFAGVVPVAILTTDTFDASTVDPVSIGLAGGEVRMRGNSGRSGALADVDGDGDLDLIVQVLTEQMAITGSETELELTGTTFDGAMIRGTDSVRIVP